MSPSDTDLWFLPLGGCGEIGMNLNLFGHRNHWLMVDCGITFSKQEECKTSSAEGDDQAKDDASVTRPDSKVIQCPDPEFILQRRDQLAGIVITHAHEDHVGAVPYLWPQLKCPLYTTEFTAEVLRRKLAKQGVREPAPLITVKPDKLLQIGPFSVEWIALTHSIPEPYGLFISTDAGRLFHTADWKLDAGPVVGKPYDQEIYQKLADQNIRAIICDSTNALNEGHSHSEAELATGLGHWIAKAKGKVVVTCFGSNIARLQTICRVALAHGRYPGLLGYALHNMTGAAKATGYWPEELSLSAPHHLGYLPSEEVLYIATGSQGEPNTALMRLAMGTHREAELAPGDMVIFSSRVIPGNENDVMRLVERLRQRGVIVVEGRDDEPLIHASGHPYREELKQLYHWVKPDIAVPVHGEGQHLLANAEVAASTGIRHTLVGKNGDLFQLGQQIAIRRQFAKTGRLEITNHKHLNGSRN